MLNAANSMYSLVDTKPGCKSALSGLAASLQYSNSKGEELSDNPPPLGMAHLVGEKIIFLFPR